MRQVLDILAAGGLLLALGGCALFTPVNASPVSEAATVVTRSIVPASVSWPLAVGSILITAAAVFTWVALGNRRRALLMLAAAIACAVLPPILLDLFGKLVWPLVVVTTLVGLAAVAYAARWAWDTWRK